MHTKTEGIVKTELYLKTNTFKEGWKSLNTYVLDIKKMITDDLEDQSENSVKYAIVKLFNEHIPDQINRKNIFWNCSIQYNRVFLKTDKNIAFGWSTNFKKIDQNKYEAESYNFNIIIYNKNEYMIKLLLDAGWEKIN